MRERAEQGWRLVQVLAPGTGGLWASADYVEVIFERKSESKMSRGPPRRVQARGRAGVGA